jgi:hypothetical protein
VLEAGTARRVFVICVILLPLLLGGGLTAWTTWRARRRQA